MRNDAALSPVIPRERLIAKLKDNREAHTEAYVKAMEGYFILAAKELEKLKEKVANNEPIGQYLGVTAPENHTQDYDDALESLEWDTRPELQLTQSEFKQYVLDDWGWKQQWTTSNTNYIAAASA